MNAEDAGRPLGEHPWPRFQRHLTDVLKRYSDSTRAVIPPPVDGGLLMKSAHRQFRQSHGLQPSGQ